MKKPKGSRHRLLFYSRSMDRVWQYTLWLGLILLGVGWFTMIRPRMILGMHSDIWLFGLAMLSFLVCGYAFLARYFAFVQPCDSYLLFSLPFFRMKISYQRIRGLRPSLLQQVYDLKKQKWAMKTFLGAFYGKTVLVVELNSFPLPGAMMKLFVPGVMFAPEFKGLVFAVPDWMKLSTELDTFYGSWKQVQVRSRKEAFAR
jgi:hypothetical protein